MLSKIKFVSLKQVDDIDKSWGIDWGFRDSRHRILIQSVHLAEARPYLDLVVHTRD